MLEDGRYHLTACRGFPSCVGARKARVMSYGGVCFGCERGAMGGDNAPKTRNELIAELLLSKEHRRRSVSQ